MRIITTHGGLAASPDQRKNEKIAVFDREAGPFDISILRCRRRCLPKSKPPTAIPTWVGRFHQVFERASGVGNGFEAARHRTPPQGSMALQCAQGKHASRPKRSLSADEYSINRAFNTADESGAKHLQLEITRPVRKLVAHLIERRKNRCLTALQDAGYKPGDIDEVLLGGGMTRMPRCAAIGSKRCSGNGRA